MIYTIQLGAGRVGRRKKIINTDVLEFPLLVDIVNPSLGPQRLTEVHELLALY